MKPLIPLRFVLPLGLLILAFSIVVKHYFQISDVVDGFLKGLSIGIIFLSLIKRWYLKRPENKTPE